MIKLIYEVYSKDIQRVKIFKSYEKAFVADLLTSTRPFQAIRGEKLFSEGDVLNDIIFISNGTIVISKFDGNNDVVLGFSRDGGYFGDFEFVKNTTCIANYSAATNCNLLALSHSVINRVMMMNLDSASRFKSELENRYHLFLKVFAAPVLDNHTLANGMSSQAKSDAWHKTVQATPVSDADRKQIWLDGVLRSNDVVNNFSNLSVFTDHKESELQTFKVVTLSMDGDLITVERDIWSLTKALIVHPKDMQKIYWDIFVGLWVIASVLVAPVDIAFSSSSFGSTNIPDIVFSVIFCIDMLVSFRTAFVLKDEDAYVIIPQLMYYNYIKTWFTIDFVSTVPLEMIMSTVSSANTFASSSKLIKILRLFRLVKLTRIFKLKVYLVRLESMCGIPATLFDFLSLMIKVVFIGHFIACFWWGMCSIMSPTGSAWFDQDEIVGTDALRHDKTSERYLWSLYWAIATLTTVGYGDVHSWNTSERALNIFVLFISASVFGLIVANVSEVMEGMDRKSSLTSNRMLQISEYLKEKKCPHELSNIVLRHYQQLFALKSSSGGKDLLSNLPCKIKNSILYIQYRSKLENIAVFKFISNQTIVLYLFELMKPIFFQPGQIVMLEGDSATDILFFVSGSAVAFKKHKYKISSKNKKAKTPPTQLSEKANIENLTPGSTLELFPELESKQYNIDTEQENESKVIKMRRFVLERSERLQSAIESISHHSGNVPSKLKNMESMKVSNDADNESSPATKNTSYRRYIRGIYETFGGTKGKKIKPLRSKESVSNLMASLLANSEDEEKDDEKEQMFVQYENFLSWCHNDDELRRHNLLMMGDILPGNFVGHVALMERMKQKVSVVATTVCCAYAFSSTEISRLIRVEPSVAVQFQHALSSAIREQSNTWGKTCTSQRKVTFVKHLKKQFYSIRESKLDDSAPSLVITPRKTYLRLWKIHPILRSRFKPKHSIHTTSYHTKMESFLSEARVLKDSDSEEEDLNSRNQELGLRKKPFRLADKSILGVAKGIGVILRLRHRHQRKILKSWSSSDLQRVQKNVNIHSVNESVLKAWSGDQEAKGSSDNNRNESQPSKSRRQSFPSLENREWKSKASHMGFL